MHLAHKTLTQMPGFLFRTILNGTNWMRVTKSFPP